MSRIRRILLYALIIFTGLVAVANPNTGHAAAKRPILRVLVAGDSYSSGEGLENNTIGEKECQRGIGRVGADKKKSASLAWGQQVMEAMSNGELGQWDLPETWFAACTGAVSENFAVTPQPKKRTKTQLGEAKSGIGDKPFDAVMFTFGGNDIGFSDIIADCIGYEVDWTVVFEGCATTIDDLQARIDKELKLRATGLYQQVLDVTAPGALIVVAGYPQVLAPSTDWPIYAQVSRCHGLLPEDVPTLREVGNRLNETLKTLVAEQQKRDPKRTWLFADVRSEFNGHELCGKGEDWVNGISWPKERSFHPKQLGHNAYARIVKQSIRDSGWKPVGSLPDPTPTPTTDPDPIPTPKPTTAAPTAIPDAPSSDVFMSCAEYADAGDGERSKAITKIPNIDDDPVTRISIKAYCKFFPDQSIDGISDPKGASRPPTPLSAAERSIDANAVSCREYLNLRDRQRHSVIRKALSDLDRLKRNLAWATFLTNTACRSQSSWSVKQAVGGVTK
jgi:lysophospholipase L1-like esterase